MLHTPTKEHHVMKTINYQNPEEIEAEMNLIKLKSKFKHQNLIILHGHANIEKGRLLF